MKINDKEWNNIKEKLEEIVNYCNKVKLNSKDKRELIMFSLSAYVLAFFLVLLTDFANLSLDAVQWGLFLFVSIIFLLVLPWCVILFYFHFYDKVTGLKSFIESNGGEIENFDIPFTIQISPLEEKEIINFKRNINCLIGHLQLTSVNKWRSMTIITSTISIFSGLIAFLAYHHLPYPIKIIIAGAMILVIPFLTILVSLLGKRILTF
jgi:hypothetical protein